MQNTQYSTAVLDAPKAPTVKEWMRQGELDKAAEQDPSYLGPVAEAYKPVRRPSWYDPTQSVGANIARGAYLAANGRLPDGDPRHAYPTVSKTRATYQQGSVAGKNHADK